MLFELISRLEEAPSLWSGLYKCENSCPWPQNRAKPRSSHWDQSHGHWPCAVTAVLAPDGVNHPSWKRQGPAKENMTPSPWCCSFEILSWCEICPLMLSLLLWPCLWSFPQVWWSRFWCILGYVLQARVLCSLCSSPFSSSFFLLCFLLPLTSYSYFYFIFFSPLVSVTSLLTPWEWTEKEGKTDSKPVILAAWQKIGGSLWNHVLGVI